MSFSRFLHSFTLCRRFSKSKEERRDDDHVEEGRTHESAKNHGGHGCLNLVSWLVSCENERNQGERVPKCRHENGKEPFHGPSKNRVVKILLPFFALNVANVGDEHDSVSSRDAKDSDKSDHGSDRKDSSAQVHAANGPDEAKDADVGIAAGAGRAVIFRKGEKVRVVAEEDMLTALMEEVEKTPVPNAG